MYKKIFGWQLVKYLPIESFTLRKLAQVFSMNYVFPNIAHNDDLLSYLHFLCNYSVFQMSYNDFMKSVVLLESKQGSESSCLKSHTDRNQDFGPGVQGYKAV